MKITLSTMFFLLVSLILNYDRDMPKSIALEGILQITPIQRIKVFRGVYNGKYITIVEEKDGEQYNFELCRLKEEYHNDIYVTNNKSYFTKFICKDKLN